MDVGGGAIGKVTSGMDTGSEKSMASPSAAQSSSSAGGGFADEEAIGAGSDVTGSWEEGLSRGLGWTRTSSERFARRRSTAAE